jgi:peptide/nickel transport system permease protein
VSRVRYVLTRTVQTVFLLWLVLTFLFLLFRLMPGSFADRMLASGAGPESVAAFEAKWGLDDPLHVQYLNYVVNFVQLDMGTSLQFRIPVTEYVQTKILNSFILMAPAITIAYLVGSSIGTITGRTRGSVIERYGIIPIVVLGSFPAFFTAIVLVIVFAGGLDLFPTSGMITAETTGIEGAWWRPYLTRDFASHYVLPFTAVFLRYLYLPTLIMRTSVVEVMGQDFLFYHRMTGISKAREWLHTTKHASLPVITLYPVSMTRAIGGLVLIEVVFNWPGMGFALIEGVLSRDFPVVQFVFFLVAAFVIISNFAIDIVYGLIDPRVSVDEGG